MRPTTGLAWGGWQWLGALVLVAGCKEPNPAFDGPAGGSGSGGSEDTATPPATDGPMTTSGVGGTDSSTSGADTNPPGDSSDGANTTEPGTSSTGGGDDTPYPPCNAADPACVDPYVSCDDDGPDFNVCTLPCNGPSDCPQPLSGDAQVACGGQGGDVCLLDCSGGATCPDGMECRSTGPGGNLERCFWPT